jgi:CRISPR-associated endonuclease/helicase Cas3
MRELRSHPDKRLYDHISGVVAKTLKYTSSPVAIASALFHDLGKVNPHFQSKLDGKNTGYNSHAYLSALAWLCFLFKNKSFFDEKFGNHPEHIFSVAAIVAKHHGDLPDLENGFFDEMPKRALLDFLSKKEHIPISNFLSFFIEHTPFDFNLNFDEIKNILENYPLKFRNKFSHNEDPLDFFLETQFSFAALVHADKRDASDNEVYHREDFGALLRGKFMSCLDKTLGALKAENSLNQLRTQIRKEATKEIQIRLKEGQRIFTLTAPTGSGKTLMLLALANEILKVHPKHDFLYALPFLSITEQVEQIASDMFGPELVQRIDSKSVNPSLQALFEGADNDPEKLQTAVRQMFSADTFDHPFIITTFVRLFETLVSNQNAELLKLPNFSKRIFLIDEIQALPPRLYLFFIAFMEAFCRKFDSYAIFSTATMPYLELPEKYPPQKAVRKLFKDYPAKGQAAKFELLDAPKYFSSDVFNRYIVERVASDNLDVAGLSGLVADQKASCLIILNTIQDTKDLYAALFDSGLNCVLLNTHFHPADRKSKIALCKDKLSRGENVILISTQLIEAGVDIDFPVVFRDLCPLPNLIQSAGRCNRNGKATKGRVYFIELKGRNGKNRAEAVYRDVEIGKRFLEFCQREIQGAIEERNLFDIQRRFFEVEVGGLIIGCHNLWSGREIDMVDCVAKAKFETLGKFKLIDEKEFGNAFSFYVPSGDSDSLWNEWQKSAISLDQAESFEERAVLTGRINTLRAKLSERIVSVRHRSENPPFYPSDPVLGIYLLPNAETNYSSETGIADFGGAAIL